MKKRLKVKDTHSNTGPVWSYDMGSDHEKGAVLMPSERDS